MMTLDEIKAAAEHMAALDDQIGVVDEYDVHAVEYAARFARALLAALPVVAAAQRFPARVEINDNHGDAIAVIHFDDLYTAVAAFDKTVAEMKP